MLQEEWLCLKCQTQKALSGQLGDSGKMPRPVLAIAVTKESAPTSGAVKATMEPISAKTGTTPTLLTETTSLPPEVNDSYHAALVSTPETNLISLPPLKETAPKPQAEVPNVDVPTVVEAEKADPNTFKQPEIEASKLTATATQAPAAESGVVPTSTVAAKVALAGHSTGRQTELSTEDSITKEARPDDYIKEIQATKSLQQVEMQLTLQEPHLEAKAEITAAGTDTSSKTTEDVDIISSEKTTKSIVIEVRLLCHLFYFFLFDS